jgi:hypothetical protein
MVPSAGRIGSRPRPKAAAAGIGGAGVAAGEGATPAKTAPAIPVPAIPVLAAGRSVAGLPWCAAFMNRLQTSTGRPPPVASLVGEESSLPSHTPLTSWLV